MICDVGANVSCRPSHLYQYGLMAGVYMRSVCAIADPRVGLLNVGEEDAKGNSLVKEARELMKADPAVNFAGNMEGRDLFSGLCDVLICDGFVGNVMLKLIEGMAESVLTGILGEMTLAMPEMAHKIAQAGSGLLKKWDFNEHGGAPLLGIGGICVICHGATNSRGIMNAVVAAKNLARHQVNKQICELLSRN